MEDFRKCEVGGGCFQEEDGRREKGVTGGKKGERKSSRGRE